MISTQLEDKIFWGLCISLKSELREYNWEPLYDMTIDLRSYNYTRYMQGII